VQQSKLQIIRKACFTAAPWKNGGGITHEAIRVPATGDPFRWRVSVAHIDVSGPFSEFADYNRKMVLLQGAGIELRFGGGAKQMLRQVGDLIEFDGAASAYCELLQGPCVDLNLMVMKADSVAVRVERFIESLAIGAAHEETTLIFPIDRGCTADIEAEKSVSLEPWDLAMLSHGAGYLRRPAASDSTATTVFLATLKLMSGE
jgi:environmental stress-induced protein Ves